MGTCCSRTAAGSAQTGIVRFSSLRGGGVLGDWPRRRRLLSRGRGDGGAVWRLHRRTPSMRREFRCRRAHRRPVAALFER